MTSPLGSHYSRRHIEGSLPLNKVRGKQKKKPNNDPLLGLRVNRA